MEVMLNNVEKSKLRKIYEDHVLYKLIAQVCGKFFMPDYHFSGMPIDIFEQVILCLEKVKKLEEEECLLQLSNMWTDVKCAYQESFPEMGEKTNELVCVTLCFFRLCLDFLTGDMIPNNMAYYNYSRKIAQVLKCGNPSWRICYISMLSHPLYKKLSVGLRDWALGYVVNKSVSYLNNEGELKTNISKNGQAKERRKEVLFAVPDDRYEKDNEKTSYWKNCFLGFLEETVFSEKVIDTTNDNKVIMRLVAFRQYWIETMEYKLPTAGAPYYRFLTEDCEITYRGKSTTKAQSFIGDKLKNYEVSDGLKFQVKKYIREYEEKNGLP